MCQQRRQEAFSSRASPKPSETKGPVIVVSELSEVAIHFIRRFFKYRGKLQVYGILQPHRISYFCSFMTKAIFDYIN